MTDIEIIIVVAKLDGNVACDMWMLAFHPLAGLQKSNCGHDKCYPQQFPPRYLEFRDAIIPVIEKQPRKVQLNMFEYLSCDFESHPDEDYIKQRLLWALTLTARQLCIALVKATNNWKC